MIMEPNKALGFATLLILVFTVKIGCIGLALWFEATYPAARDRMLTVYQTRRRKCIITGAVNAILGILLILFLFATKVLALPGILLLGALITLIVLGYGIAYRDFGARLAPPNPEATPRTTLLGGLTLEAAFLAPVFGQLLALTILARGLGAVIIALLARNAPAKNPKATNE
jgi:hypothetical protein